MERNSKSIKMKKLWANPEYRLKLERVLFKKGNTICKGLKHSEETKRKISEGNIGKNLGRKHTKEQKEKQTLAIRKAMLHSDVIENNRIRGLKSRGRYISKETREKFSRMNKGRVFSEEHKKKLSECCMGRFKGKPKSEQTKRNMSIGRKKYLKNNPIVLANQIKRLKKVRKNIVVPLKDSSIEIKVRNFLEDLEIEYYQHKYINIKHAYQCDFLIPSMNLVIECDGNYWHKYPIGRKIDNIRTSELIEKGFKVLRLWEYEINNMSLLEFQNKLKGGSD